MSETRPHRIFTTSFATVYPLYLTKVERKGRTKAELDTVIHWLTGYDGDALTRHIDAGSTFTRLRVGLPGLMPTSGRSAIGNASLSQSGVSDRTGRPSPPRSST